MHDDVGRDARKLDNLGRGGDFDGLGVRLVGAEEAGEGGAVGEDRVGDAVAGELENAFGDLWFVSR